MYAPVKVCAGHGLACGGADGLATCTELHVSIACTPQVPHLESASEVLTAEGAAVRVWVI
jgi:hypothetical protein